MRRSVFVGAATVLVAGTLFSPPSRAFDPRNAGEEPPWPDEGHAGPLPVQLAARLGTGYPDVIGASLGLRIPGLHLHLEAGQGLNAWTGAGLFGRLGALVALGRVDMTLDATMGLIPSSAPCMDVCPTWGFGPGLGVEVRPWSTSGVIVFTAVDLKTDGDVMLGSWRLGIGLRLGDEIRDDE